MNSTKGVKNLAYGILAQVLAIGIGILIPRLVLVNLGSDANGLLSSVGSILAYMALLEAGVGAATLQALYKPIANSDNQSINEILSATNYFYKRTGYIYLALVIGLSFLYTFVAETTLPRFQVWLVVLMSGLSGVLSYFFQGKYRILLDAEGKSYILTNMGTIVNIGVSVTKAAVLILGANVVAVQSIYFFANLLQVIYIVGYMRRHYPWIDLSVKPNLSAISQKNAALVHQVSGLIFGNTDILLLTTFASLKDVSVYSMYAMIYGMVKSVSITISDSFIYMLGQAYEDKPRFNRLFDTYEVYSLTVTSSLFCVCFILILPFLKLYTAGINDINYIDVYLSILFAVFYLLHNGRKSSAIVINIAQHFEQTKWRSILESAINLGVSITLVPFLGIYGVLLGTIAALLYRTNDMILYAARLMGRSPWVTYKRWFTNICTFIVCVLAASFFPLNASNYLEICIYGVVLCVTIVPFFVLINSVLEIQTAKRLFSILKNMLSAKLKHK